MDAWARTSELWFRKSMAAIDATQKLTFRDVGEFNGQCRTDASVWYSSPYEFVSEREVALLKYPQTLQEDCNTSYHALLTDAGCSKLVSAPSARTHDIDLEAGGLQSPCRRRHDVVIVP